MATIQLKICGMHNDGYGNVSNVFHLECSENWGLGYGVSRPEKVRAITKWDRDGKDRLGRPGGAAYHVPNFELIDETIAEFLKKHPEASIVKSGTFEIEEKKFRQI